MKMIDDCSHKKKRNDHDSRVKDCNNVFTETSCKQIITQRSSSPDHKDRLHATTWDNNNGLTSASDSYKIPSDYRSLLLVVQQQHEYSRDKDIAIVESSAKTKSKRYQMLRLDSEIHQRQPASRHSIFESQASTTTTNKQKKVSMRRIL